MNALLCEIRALPLTNGILAVRVLADEVAAGRDDKTRYRSAARTAYKAR